mgnify:CR=1 FL=1
MEFFGSLGNMYKQIGNAVPVKLAELVAKGIKKEPNYQSLKSIAEIQELAKERWIIPRSKRNHEYKNFKVEELYKRITT